MGVRDGNQKSGSLARRTSVCSFSSCKRASSSASRVRRSTSVVSNSNFRFFPRATRCDEFALRRHNAVNSLPESIAEGTAEAGVGVVFAGLADNPKWVFSKSFKTRSRAASTARFFSSSASAFKAASLAFCFLISRLCVTLEYQHPGIGASTISPCRWTKTSSAPKSVKTHSVQNRCPSLQASGVRARSRQREHALNSRIDSFPSLCRFVP